MSHRLRNYRDPGWLREGWGLTRVIFDGGIPFAVLPRPPEISRAFVTPMSPHCRLRSRSQTGTASSRLKASAIKGPLSR